MDLTSPIEIKRIMEGLGRGFNKSLGQNFLIDRSVIDTISASCGVDKSYGVIEIGPGIGTLTAELCEIAGKVVSVELDRGIFEYLCRAFSFYDNVKFIQGDALKTDLAKIIREEFGDMPCAVVANLPYYITTPLIMKFLESDLPLRSITVMVQKEVAMRLNAVCGTKDYGAITAAVAYYADCEIVSYVPPESFMPPPKVTSAVVRLDIFNHKTPEVADKNLLFKIIRASFAQRRKTLANGLCSAFPELDKDFVKKVISDVSGNEKIRGEQLDLVQFIQICEKFGKNNCNLTKT